MLSIYVSYLFLIPKLRFITLLPKNASFSLIFYSLYVTYIDILLSCLCQRLKQKHALNFELLH